MFSLPFLTGSCAEKLNSLKPDFLRSFVAHLGLNCLFTISKAFVSSEAEFVEVRFFVSVSCSSWPNIVIST